MKRILSLFLFLLLMCAGVFAPVNSQSQPTPSLAIIHANLIDGVSSAPIRDVTLLIRDGRIESVSTSKTEIPSGISVFDLKGRWLLPGFVDAHAHLADLGAARRALASGATTVRCLGVNHFVDIGFRELNHAGVVDIPDVVAAGYHVRPRPAEEFFLDNPKMKDLMGGVKGPESVRRLVRAMIDRGADVIKIMATERAGLPDTDPRKRVFSDEELIAAVDEARKSNVYVAAHAHGDEGAAAAVRAGVRSIEHGTYLSDQTLTMMKEKGTYLVPTIATVMDLIDPGGDYDDPVLSVRGRAMLPRIRETTAHALKMGVKIVAGTDTGYGPSSRRRIPHEIIELVNIGMTPIDAIKASTSVAATCIGVDRRTGSIKPGMEADLIAIERDPTVDITAIQDVIVVINNGKIAVNRLNW
ncbi:MAG TPA: amidohydrolase family protein [Blastocatellia bacterium]|nr:amidohydrolase family protein [Blastocatellia bacterium]